MTKENSTSLPKTVAEIFERVDKYASIIAAIIAALTFHRGNRFVSYAFVVIGWLLMASFLWRVVRRERITSRAQRWVAGIALGVLTIFCSVWFASNGWRDYQAWCYAGRYPLCPKPDLLVLIAQFDNRGSKGIDTTQRIYTKLRQELEKAGIAGATLKRVSEIADQEEAKRVGERRGAMFVIWGWFDDVGFAPRFTIVPDQDEQPLLLKDVELEEVSLEPPTDFSLYIREGLPAQMAYFSTLTIGQIYYWDRAYDTALRAFDRAKENAREGGTSTGLAQVHFYSGYIHQEHLGDVETAIADYDRAIDLEPEYAEAYNNRGNAYLDLGDLERAVEDYDRSLELGNPEPHLVYNNRGNAYRQQSEYERAIGDYEQAIELQPDFAEGYHNRGIAYADKGMIDQAIADYTRAIELKPGLVQAYFARGTAYVEQGGYDQAMADYNQAIALNATYAEAYNGRGIVHHHQGHYDAAIQDYTTSLELGNPEPHLVLNNRGNAYREQGDYDGAIADYDEAIERKPDYAESYNNRGIAYGALGAHDRAIADFETALELKEGYAEAYNNICWTYALEQQPEAALPYCQQAAALAPHPGIRDSLGLVHALLGDYETALAHFQAYVDWLASQPGDVGRDVLERRRAWIEALRAGRDPFTPVVLEELRHE